MDAGQGHFGPLRAVPGTWAAGSGRDRSVWRGGRGAIASGTAEGFALSSSMAIFSSRIVAQREFACLAIGIRGINGEA